MTYRLAWFWCVVVFLLGACSEGHRDNGQETGAPQPPFDAGSFAETRDTGPITPPEEGPHADPSDSGAATGPGEEADGGGVTPPPNSDANRPLRPDAGGADTGLGAGDAGLFPPADAASPFPPADAASPFPPADGGSPDRTPDPNNPPECPDVAPKNPLGSCAGLPVYVTCKYGNYTCTCDWVHWICV